MDIALAKLNRFFWRKIQIGEKKTLFVRVKMCQIFKLGAAAYQLGNTSSRTIGEVKQH